MTKGEARTLVRSQLDIENDQMVTDTQLDVWIDLEHKHVRRMLNRVAPSLYTATDTPQTVASGADTITLPADFDRLIRLERQYGTDWLPVEVSDALTPHVGDLMFREEGNQLRVDPVLLAPGTYRTVYVQAPATIATGAGTDSTALAVPQGCEEIITNRVSVRVAIKRQEDPSPFATMAAQLWDEQRVALRRRYGNHGEPGLRQVRRW